MSEQNRRISSLLADAHGIDLSRYDDSFLNKSIHLRINETHCDSREAYYHYLANNSKEGLIFISSLRISYSCFFRNSLTFSVLEHIVLPSLIHKLDTRHVKGIRIWSAACAAGQEAYSLAILLEEFKSGKPEGINYTIFATDHDENKVIEASEGKFSAGDIDNLSLKRAKSFFTKQGNIYAVQQKLKDNINFSVFDLLNAQYSSPPSSIFGNFDIVLCSNLLYYYKTEYRKVILEKAGNSLSKNGYLIADVSERNILIENDYTEVFPSSGIFRKS